MARKSRHAAAEATDEPTPTEAERIVNEATDFDPAKLEQRGVEPPPPTHAERFRQPGEDDQERPRVKIPEPFDQVTVELTADPDHPDRSAKNGPKARLLLKNREGEIWMQFDENPGVAITDQIKAAGGWKWNSRANYGSHKGAWVYTLEEGNAWGGELDARRLFEDLVNEIRQGNGLGPTKVMGVPDR
jgi:hypothetical protein